MHYKVNKTPTKTVDGEKLYRIKATRDFEVESRTVLKGTIGGLIGKNVKLLNDSWVEDGSIVFNGTLQSSYILKNSIIKGDHNYERIISSTIYDSEITMSRISDSNVFRCKIKNSEYTGFDAHDTIINDSYVSSIVKDSRIESSYIYNSNVIDSIIINSKLMESWIDKVELYKHEGMKLRFKNGKLNGGYSAGGMIYNCDHIHRIKYTGPLNFKK